MDACALNFSLLDVSSVEPEVNIQLPTEVWSDASMNWDVKVETLTAVLAKLPVECKSPISSQQISSEEWDSEGSSPGEMVETSFNSMPSPCESIGHSFNSIPASWSTDFGSASTPGSLAARKEKKPKKKNSMSGPSGIPPQSAEDKDLDYKKYKTRLCRNWQQTGKCPYGEACVYAHGVKEVRGEQENEAVVTSLSKLADQLTKQLGSLGKLNATGAPLRPLRYRKPKATKKGPKDTEPSPYMTPQPQYMSPMASHPIMFAQQAYFGQPWGQA